MINWRCVIFNICRVCYWPNKTVCCGATRIIIICRPRRRMDVTQHLLFVLWISSLQAEGSSVSICLSIYLSPGHHKRCTALIVVLLVLLLLLLLLLLRPRSRDVDGIKSEKQDKEQTIENKRQPLVIYYLISLPYSQFRLPIPCPKTCPMICGGDVVGWNNLHLPQILHFYPAQGLADWLWVA